ncbi:MAG: DUF2752 domain-containing protein [Acidimicrobiia bacterium]
MLTVEAERNERRARLAVVAVGVGALVAAGVYRIGDPNAGGFPACPLYSLTGWLCPGCGTQRGLHALAHLDLPGALAVNALMVLTLPVLAYAYLAWGSRVFASGAVPPLRLPARAVLVAVLCFTVVRNLPFGAAFAP